MHVGNWNACPLALSMWHSVLSIDILRHYCFRSILPYRPVTTFLLFLDADFLQCFLPLLLLLVLRNLQNTVTSVLSYVPLIPSLDPISPVLIYSSHVIARKLRVTSTNTALRKLQSCWWYTAWNKSCLSVKRTKNIITIFQDRRKLYPNRFPPRCQNLTSTWKSTFYDDCSVDDFWWSLLVVHNVLRLCSWMVL